MDGMKLAHLGLFHCIGNVVQQGVGTPRCPQFRWLEITMACLKFRMSGKVVSSACLQLSDLLGLCFTLFPNLYLFFHSSSCDKGGPSGLDSSASNISAMCLNLASSCTCCGNASWDAHVVSMTNQNKG